MSAEKPRHQRPEFADFWDQRFQNGITPWEAGQAPQLLCEFAVRYEQAHQLGGQPGTRPGSSSVRWRVLVPGCGSAWDAAFLASRGWSVTALDFSTAAVASARATLGDSWQGTLLLADFFSFDLGTAFDVIYERAFLCALPRHR